MISLLLVKLLTGVVGCTLVVIYLYLVRRKLVNQTYHKRKRVWLERHLQVLKKYLATGRWGKSELPPRSLRPKQDYHYEALEELFSDFLNDFKVDEEYNPVKTMIEAYFVDRYKKRLHHRKWSVRMNTMYVIDLFHVEILKNEVLGILSDKRCTPEEEYQVYLLLASFQYDGLLELFLKSKGMPPFLLNELLFRLVNQENIDEYVMIFDELPIVWQLGILDVIRDKHLRSGKLQELLENKLEAEESEIRIRTIKTLGSLGYVTSTDIITRTLDKILDGRQSKNPKASGEKLMLARLMGSIRREIFLPYLERLISDSAYIVRSEAAKSIRKYSKGSEILLAIASTHSDAYARNISKEWLERSLDYE